MDQHCKQQQEVMKISSEPFPQQAAGIESPVAALLWCRFI
jgi:hypothetical protein